MKTKELRKSIDELLQEEIKSQEKMNSVILELAKEKDNQCLIDRLDHVRKESMEKIMFLKDCLAIIDDPKYKERLIVDKLF